MSEPNRYRVAVTREGIVYADNTAEAEQYALEESDFWPVVIVDCESVPARDPVQEIERRINGDPR
jgi:hypothetical protein